jgi:hypothetical protein
MIQYIPGPSLQLPNLGLEIQGLDTQLYREAGNLFHSLLRQSRLKHLWNNVRRQSGTLLDLSSVQKSCRVTSQYSLGAESISLENIIGTSSRSQDFDSEFRPLHSHLKQRWVKIAALRLMNVSLPAVELVRIGEAYFVIDGHHRISVARALEQTYIDAQVIVWHLEVRPYPEMAAADLLGQNFYPSSLRLAKGG